MPHRGYQLRGPRVSFVVGSSAEHRGLSPGVYRLFHFLSPLWRLACPPQYPPPYPPTFPRPQNHALFGVCLFCRKSIAGPPPPHQTYSPRMPLPDSLSELADCTAATTATPSPHFSDPWRPALCTFGITVSLYRNISGGTGLYRGRTGSVLAPIYGGDGGTTSPRSSITEKLPPPI